MEKKTIGKFISVLRKANGMTQKEFGEKLFVSDKTVSRWECDECTPDLSLLPSIAELFGITVDELIRGERNSPDITAEQSNRQEIKSAGKFKLLIRHQKAKFFNLSCLSIGLISAGLIAAAICNLVFSRGLLGFCLASVFFLSAAICQICFTANSRIFIEDYREEFCEEVRKINTEAVLKTIRIFFGILSAWIFCLPPAIFSPGTNYGLNFNSWLSFGFLFVGISFSIAFILYRLIVLKLLLRKKVIFLRKEEELALHRNNRLLKKTLAVFIAVFAVLTIGYFVVCLLYHSNVFVQVRHFTDPDEFIQYVQRQYDEWYEEGYGNLPPSEYPTHEYLKDWAEIDGKSYYYQSKLYSRLHITESDSGEYDIEVITTDSIAHAQKIYDIANITLLVLHFFNLSICICRYCLGKKKKE